MRVLAADDDEALARVLDRHLRGWGYEAVIARDGVGAWNILKHADAPRIVVLDWDMPGLTGVEVCRLLRATDHGAGAYVLMLTGRAETDDLIQALESGADDFLSKPFHPRELQLRLAKGVRDAFRTTSAAPHREPNAPLSGTTLGGKYRLERQIGEGGMGSVWLGVHLALGINVAIKFMAKDLAETPDYASFEREARAAAQLRNPHVLRVYDHGVMADGLPYLVMEYLAGESLLARIDRLGALSGRELSSLVEQTASALGEAHERGLVHGDVKPGNILVLDDADAASGFSVKLIDFGLARACRTPRSRTPMPGYLGDLAGSSRPIAGTPGFLSPEVWTSSGPPSHRLDLWALAVTAFFVVTGALPFEAETLGELHRRVCVEPLPRASEVRRGVPASFDAWFERACARDPKARFQTAAELAKALTAAIGSGPVPEPSRGPAKAASFAPTEPDSGVGRAVPDRRRPR